MDATDINTATASTKLYDGDNVTFSKLLTEGENMLLQHVTRYGSTGYPIGKVGRFWHWRDAFGVKGSPTPYKTKRAAHEAFQAWQQLMLDIKAGRVER